MPPRLTATRSTLLVALAMTLVTPLACRSATEPGERVRTLYVAPTRVPCIVMAPQQCLQVRERTDLPYTLAQVADDAIGRGGELRELWEESAELAEWQKSVEDLRSRLA